SYGPDGFVPAGEPAPGRFPGDLAYHTDLWDVMSPNCLAFPGGVYDIDFGRHTLQTLFTPADGETVLAARRWKSPKQKWELLLVSSEKRVHVLTLGGAPILSVPRAYDRGSYTVSVGRLDDPEREVIWYGPLWFLQPEDFKTMPVHLVEYDTAGREVARRDVP